jgi:hypothetical protein
MTPGTIDSQASLSDESTNETETYTRESEPLTLFLAPSSATFVRHRKRYVPVKRRKLRNSLLELASVGSFVANVRHPISSERTKFKISPQPRISSSTIENVSRPTTLWLQAWKAKRKMPRAQMWEFSVFHWRKYVSAKKSPDVTTGKAESDSALTSLEIEYLNMPMKEHLRSWRLSIGRRARSKLQLSAF